MHKHRFGLRLVIVILCCVGVYYGVPGVRALSHQLISQAVRWARQGRTVADEDLNRLFDRNQSAPGSAAGVTPREAIIPKGELSGTYTYRFAPGTAPRVRYLFTQAIHRYNQTGIVTLRSGAKRPLANHLTLGSYDKVQTTQTGIILGNGGSTVLRWSGRTTGVVNQGTARLNVAYLSRLSLAVALHELGHALGLGHSRSVKSVMFPMDLEVTKLSRADLAGLRVIYRNQK